MKFGRIPGGNAKRPRGRAQFNLRGRLMLVGGGLGLMALILVGRAVDLQLIDNAFYQQKADSRFLRELPIATSRGMITDRNGEPLAISTPVASLWANPQELSKHPERIPELAEAIGQDADALARAVAQRAEREFMYLPGQRRIHPANAEKVLALRVPGVFSQREFRRFYPQGEALAHVLGFTNIDDRGQEGIELAYDDWLRGHAGAERVIRDRRGRIVESVDLVRAAQPGKDLTLSIDRRIQYLVHRELRNTLIEHKASAGSAVILDVATGEILAMANLPTYNPHVLGGTDREARRNRAVTDLIEPGSTIKPLTVAAGLEAGVIRPETLINTSPGWMPNGRFRTTDFRNYGTLDVTGVITKSSNVGVSKIVHMLSDDQFYQLLHRFGFGRSTGSGFPGEAAGFLRAPSSWDGTMKQTMSYGYSMSVTPLQIAAAYAALGNGGKLISPTFVKGQHNAPREVLDPRIAGEVMRMMQTVTEPGGTATRAAVLGYHVAGKTGTARKASGGSYARRYVAFFAGLVPVDNPRFAMVIVIDDPDTTRGPSTYGGGYVAAPMFRGTMEGTLRLMDVPPDDIETWLAAQADAERRRRATAGRQAPARPAATATAAAPASRTTPAAAGTPASSAAPVALTGAGR